MSAKHNCGIYVRVSTQRQASVHEGSLDAQTSHLEAYVDFENRSSGDNWTVVEVYREEGKSGKDLRRPEFERMMRDIESGHINTIIIWKIDRLTRSLADFCKVWDMLEATGVQLISLNEKFDTETALGRAMLKIILIFAELEREQTGERTSATLAHRAAQGLWNGGRIIGYDPDPESKGGLRIHQEYAELVRTTYDTCIDTSSASATMRSLNEKGYRMPVYESRRGKKHGGGIFTKQSVIRMLTNPVYLGQVKWKGELFQGQHEPIIDEQTFERVQQILAHNRRHRVVRRKSRRHVFTLQGLLRCGRCGSMMTPVWGTNGSGKPYHYYQCTRRQNAGKDACDSRSVPAEAIEKVILERLGELSTDEAEVNKIVNEANSRQSEMLRKLARDRRHISRQHQVVMEKLEALVRAIEDGGGAAFKSVSERMADLEAERANLEEQLTTIKFEACRIKEETLSAQAMAQTFKSFGEIVDAATPERLKELMPLIVEVIEWHEDPANPGTGHYRIAYFEQPWLSIERNLAEQSGDICSAKSYDWLPSRNAYHNTSLS